MIRITIICLLIAVAASQAVAKPKASIKVNAKIPSVKVGVKAGVKAGVKLGAAALKTAAAVASAAKKTAVKVGAKVKVAVKAAVKIVGSCPQAKNFGFVPVTPMKADGLPICTSLKETCCTKASMVAYKTNFEKWMKKLSAVMWSVTKIPVMQGNLFNALKVNAPAKPAVKKMRILQAVKANLKLKVPNPVAAAAAAAKAGAAAMKKGAKVAAAGAKLAVKVGAAALKTGAKVAAAGAKIGAKVAAGVKLNVKAAIPKIKVTLKAVAKKIANPKTYGVGKLWRAPFVLAWTSFNKFAKKRSSFAEFGQKCFAAIAETKLQMACAACDNAKGSQMLLGIPMSKATAKPVIVHCTEWFYMLKNLRISLKNTLYYVAAVTANPAIGAAALTLASNADLDLGGCAPANAETPLVKAVVKVKAGIKKAGLAIKAGIKKAGVAIKVGAAKAAAAAKKAGAAIKAGAKVAVAGAKKVAGKVAATIKGGAKLNVKVGVKAKRLQAVVPSASTITEDSWTGFVKDGDANPVKIATLPDSIACLSSASSKIFMYQVMMGKGTDLIGLHVNHMFKALDFAITAAGNTKIHTTWKNFKGTKAILGLSVKAAINKIAAGAKKMGAAAAAGAKKMAAGAKKVAAAAAAGAKKMAAGAKKVAAAIPKVKVSIKKRRLQSVVPSIVPSTTTILPTGGVDATNYKLGITIPTKIVGDGQAAPAAANLLKALSLALLALFFFN